MKFIDIYNIDKSTKKENNNNISKYNINIQRNWDEALALSLNQQEQAYLILLMIH